ncbi:hypothetical protein CD351_11882 [Erythrobacter sp. KY5]|uniref:reductase n=1 Tax=Erythrobacter sp. KY5 TaxID=2011159 RepID=UPI000DBEFD2B|nr:reductase [Erythrobacter sp. KY5]AWW75863.1 hypothetical protein CD351_11882 [Erythrobacter sp. KY5]
MARSVAIIGAGQIGYAAAYNFAFHGWDVRIHSRTRPAWALGERESFVPYIAGEDPAPHADVVLDTIAFDEEDVAPFDPDAVGRLIAISSASVYCDDKGRTLDEAATNGFPEFDGPITEKQSTVVPGPDTYSTRKVRMENKALDLFGNRATILRPCALFGKYSRHPRELWFVKRLLDGRSRIPLAFGGRSQFSTTSSFCLGSNAQKMAADGAGGVFNMADDPARTVAEIGRVLAEWLGYQAEFHLMDGPPQGSVGRTPWSVPEPFVVSNAKADKAAYFCVASELLSSAQWLIDLNPADWREAFPQLAAYPWDMFDYEAEDRFFASL